MPKTSELPIVTSAASGDKVIGLVGGVTSQITKANLLAGGGLLSRAEAGALTNTSNISILAVYNGGVVCHYEKDASGTALTTADGQNWSPLSGSMVTPQHWGAVGDGSTDDTAALQAALDSTTEQIYFPEGVYKITTALTVTNKHKHLFGFGPRGGAEIRQTSAAANGILVTHTAPYRFVLSSLKIATTQEVSGTGVRIEYNAGTVTTFRPQNLVSFQDVSITGSSDSGDGGCWANCLVMVNCNRATLRDCFFRGRRDLSASFPDEARVWATGTTGLSFTAPTNIQPTNLRMYGCDFRHLETSFVSSGDMEGLVFDSCFFVNCKYGPEVSYVAVAPTADTTDPGLHFQSCHVNCLKHCLKISGVYEAFVTDNELYRFPFIDSEDWICVDMLSVDRSTISGNTILGNSTVGTPGYMKGFRGANTKRSFFRHNNFYNMTAGGGSDSLIEFLDNGCTDNHILDNYDSSASPALPMVTYSGTSAASLTRSHGLTGGPYLTDSATGVTVAGTASIIDSFVIPAARAVPGAQFRIRATVELAKGGTEGGSTITLQYITSTGTGSFETGANFISVRPPDKHALSTTWRTQVDGVWTVATAGNTAIAVQGTSVGSNSTGACWYTVEQIR